MNQSLETILRLLFAGFCIVFGIDKFLEFLPACSLTAYIPPSAMMATGVLEIILGIALFLNKYTLTVLRLITGLMLGGLILHLLKGTYDVGGAAFGAIVGLILIIAYKRRNTEAISITR